jgi:ribosome-associated toxin RatA of RatAB toxin-antitoxin module
MKNIEKSVLIWFSAREMFNLVADVAQYPVFLPWCASAEVTQTHADGVSAQIGMRVGPISQSFSTRNTHAVPDPGHAEHALSLALVDGPFSALSGQWRFVPVGNAAQRACRVTLSLGYEFSSPALATVLGPMFDGIVSNLVDAFVERAEVVYGDGE